MLIEFLGLKDKAISDNTWIDVASNVKSTEQMNNLMIAFQINSIFELFFDIVFCTSICMMLFGALYLIIKIYSKMHSVLNNSLQKINLKQELTAK